MPGFDETHWRVTDPPIGCGGQISLRGLPPLVVAQVVLGLQRRCRADPVRTKEAVLRAVWTIYGAARSLLDDYTPAMAATWRSTGCSTGWPVTPAGRCHPGNRVPGDVWDLTVFGHSGTVSFTGITQSWLREAAKRWAAEDLPRRRVRPGRRTRVGLAVRHHIGGLARLSESLRMRPDRGEHPAALGRADMEAFLHRLAFLESAGRSAATPGSGPAARSGTCSPGPGRWG